MSYKRVNKTAVDAGERIATELKNTLADNNVRFHLQHRKKGVSAAYTLAQPVVDADGEPIEGDSEVPLQESESTESVPNAEGWLSPYTIDLDNNEPVGWWRDERSNGMWLTSHPYDWTVIPLRFPLGAGVSHVEIGIWYRTRIFQSRPSVATNEQWSAIQAPFDLYAYVPGNGMAEPKVEFLNMISDTASPTQEVLDSTAYAELDNYSDEFKFAKVRIPMEVGVTQTDTSQEEGKDLFVVYLCLHARRCGLDGVIIDTNAPTIEEQYVHPSVCNTFFFDRDRPIEVIANGRCSDVMEEHLTGVRDATDWIAGDYKAFGRTFSWLTPFQSDFAGLTDQSYESTDAKLVLKQMPVTMEPERRKEVPPSPNQLYPPFIGAMRAVEPPIAPGSAFWFASSLVDQNPWLDSIGKENPFEDWSNNVDLKWFQWFAPVLQISSYYIREVYSPSTIEPGGQLIS